METSRFESIGHQIKGALLENIGRVIGDAKLQANGAAERAVGSAGAAGGIDRVGGVDTDRIMGVGRQFAGAVKQGVGGLMGNAKLTAAGVAERNAGKAQNIAGSVRDEAREAANAAEATETEHPSPDVH
jgi:uncharacterized protein YjbJ (UPF0337 family)